MTHDKNRKRGVHAEAKRTGRSYQQVLEERWSPRDAPRLRSRLRDLIDSACRDRLTQDPDEGDRRTELVDGLVDVAIERAFAGFGRHREEVRGEGIGRSKTESCMRLVSHFVCNRAAPPIDAQDLTIELTLAVAKVVVRRCPGHAVATDAKLVRAGVTTWLAGDDYEIEWMSDWDD